MLHLLNLEWKKQKEYVLFKVLVIVYLIALPSLLFIGKNFDVGTDSGLPFDPQIMFFHFPSVWEWLAYIGNWLGHFILGFLAVLMVTNEHNYRTLRQNIITGMQRGDWFRSKASFILMLTLGATIYYGLCAITIGLAHSETIYIATVFKGAGGVLLRYFLMTLGFMMTGLLIGVLVKRTGIAVFFYLAYTMMAEPLIRGVYFYFVKHPSWNWMPWNTFEDLCHFPVADLADEFLEDNGFQLYLDPDTASVMAVGFILLFGWLTFKRLKSIDL